VRLQLRVCSALLALVSSGCLGTRLVNLDNLDVLLPEPDPRVGWRGEMRALFERYESAPVLAPEDERLEPLFGGLTTLSYFGADPLPRVLDQRIPAHAHAFGQSLEAACEAPPDAAAERVLATSGLPALTPVWIPLSTSGDAAPPLARCDERGAVLGAADGFCSFARVALQPDPGRPLIVVVHGLFDSGAQEYVQRMAAVLYRLGVSVLLPDMRDHGDTLRAAPELATTLGTLEGPDLLALVHALRQACGARVGTAGIAGVSGGGLDAIRAFTLDQQGSLDAGVIAISPLLDVTATISDLGETGACPLTRSIELSWLDDALVAGATGATFFGGAAVVQALAGQRLDGNTALAGGIGLGTGLLTALAVDAWFDGGTKPCVGQNAMARIVRDALQVRWRSLQRAELGQTMSPVGRRTTPAAIRLDTYVRERAEFLAARRGIRMRRFDARSLAGELRVALADGVRPDARLLVIGAEDDPMTRSAALHEFAKRIRDVPQVYARSVHHGGHGGLWMVQPTVMQRVFARFFAAASQ
jgi:pimeloyl-ACP methyl ester carboxylesterase